FRVVRAAGPVRLRRAGPGFALLVFFPRRGFAHRTILLLETHSEEATGRQGVRRQGERSRHRPANRCPACDFLSQAPTCRIVGSGKRPLRGEQHRPDPRTLRKPSVSYTPRMAFLSWGDWPARTQAGHVFRAARAEGGDTQHPAHAAAPVPPPRNTTAST